MVLWLLHACASGPAGSDDTDAVVVTDLRLDEDDVVLDDGEELWFGPEVEIAPYEDKMICLFTTYTGPDAGIIGLETLQADFGHHFVLMATSTPETTYPDGTIADCTDTSDMPMTDLEPLVVAQPAEAHVTRLELPPGFATRLASGQRLILQSHYINTTDAPILVRDVMTVALAPTEEVETWVSALAINHASFSLPPQQETTSSYECALDETYEALFLTGHMHEWGRAIRFDAIVDGEAQNLFAIDEWEVTYRDAPPIFAYDTGEMVLEAGVPLRTTCTWFNDTDDALTFPHEMCTSVGMVYPSMVPIICSD